MKSLNKLAIVVAIAALAAGCEKREQPVRYVQGPQVPMVQVCGIDPEDGDQECIMVPQNQQAAYNQQGFYQYNNGQYYDSNGSALTGAALGAMAGYMAGQHMSSTDRDRQYYRNQELKRLRAENERMYREQYNKPYPHAQQYKQPVAAQSQKPFVPTAAHDASTGKAPTGGTMAGQYHQQLTASKPTPAPSQNFAPTAAPSFKPAAPAAVPNFRPTPVSAPRPAPTGFTPSSAGKQFTPSSAPSFKPAPRPSSPAFKPSAPTFKPASRPSSSSSSSFKPSSSSKRK